MNLESLMLQTCIDYYKESRKCYEEDWDGEMGPFPINVLITENKMIGKIDGDHDLEPIRQWIYVDSVLTEIPVSEKPVECPLTNGFYLISQIDFYWDLEEKEAYVDAVFAPLWGTGYTYKILSAGEDAKLDEFIIPRWIS